MPTIQELEALTQGSELPSGVGQTPAPQPAKPPMALSQEVPPPDMNPAPTLQELLRIQEPKLDYSLDAPAPLTKNLNFVADNFEPGLHWSDEDIPFEQRTASSRFREKGYEGLTDEESFNKLTYEQGAGARRILRGMRSFATTLLDVVKAPGYGAKAIHEADIAGSKGQPFEYTWKAPVTSTLLGISQVADKLQKELNGDEAINEKDPLTGQVIPEDQRPWYSKIPEAAGSAAAFMVGGRALGPTTPAGQAAVSGGLGAAQGASSQYDEALSMGADPNDAALAYLGGGAFGATEGVSGFHFLKRLNKLGLGKTMEKMQEFGMQGESGPLRETIKGILTEAAQEGVQTVGQNWVAKDLAGYDPTRTLGENFWDSVFTAGVTGGIFGGGISLLHGADVTEAKQKFEEEYQRKLMSGDPINALATPGGGFGSFTPVDTLLQLNKMKADLDEEIDAKAELALQQIHSETGGMGTGVNSFPFDPLIPNEVDADAADAAGLKSSSTKPHRVLDAPGPSQQFIDLVRDEQINPHTEKGLPKGISASEALLKTPVIALQTRYDGLVSQAETYLRHYEDMVKNPESYDFAPDNASEEDLAADPEERMTRKQVNRLYNMYKLRVDQMKQKQNIANALLQSAKDYAAAFREIYSPEMKLVIRDQGMPQDKPGTYAGWFTGSEGVDLGDGKPTPVGILYFDTDKLVTSIYKGEATKNSPEFKSAKRALFEVINHELGHSILTKHFHDVLNKVRQGSPQEAREAYKTFVALQTEYRNWISDMTQTTADQVLGSSFAIQRAASYMQSAQREGQDPKTMPVSEPVTSWPAMNYLLSFDEFFAEMTARLATQGKLANESITKFFKPVLEQYKKIFETYPEYAKSEYGNSWEKFLQQRALSYRIKQELEAIASRGGKDLYDGLRGKLDGLDPDNFVGLRQHLDHWNKGLSLGLNLLQLERMFPHVPQFATYRATTEGWASYQRNFAAQATETLEKWRSLGKKEASALTDVLFEESQAKKNLPPQVLKNKLGTEALLVYQEIRTQLNRVLDEMRSVTLLEANREFATNTEKLTQAVGEINTEFDKLKDSGYFPFIRFGNHTITARAKEKLTYLGETFKEGELITFQAFESRAERDEAYSQMRKELGNTAAVSAGKMREEDFVVQGMPRSLLLGLKNRLMKDGQLTPEVEKSIDQALESAAPFKSFRNHFKRRKGIHGYSEDAFRTFAHYIRSAAGNISRVKYAGEMRDSIDSMQADVKTIQEIGGYSEARQDMANWLKRHFDYVMNPASELAALRGVGFVAYLGFNVKSAFVNMTQQLTTTYPYLAARYGDVKAVSQLIKAQHFIKNWVFRKKDFLSAQPGSQNDRLTRLIAQGKTEGWLDQSLATELAIAASENSLDRSLYLPSYKRFWHAFSRWSALPFHLVEKSNRYVTAVAAYNLEFEQSGNHNKAVNAAKMANYQTNFENARWNRPEFLRGKKSAALLFQNFVQNQLFFVTKDPGSTRYLLMMLILAGMMGLPGADDLADVVDAAATKLNKELGMKNPKFQLRQELRNYVNELGANPDLVLHGVSQDSFGMGQVGELSGIPIPRFDLSASIGMGNIVPGTNIPGMMMQSSPGDTVLELGSQLGGASGNLVEDYYRGLFSKEPNDWKRIEKLLPLMSMRNMSKAARYAVEGQERAANGVVIADFTPYDTRSGLEIFGQSLGFPVRETTLGWEKELAKRDAVQFYKVYQSSVQRQLNIAYMQEDREAITDARAALAQYNSTVPFPEMGIKAKDAKSAVREYIRSQYKAGAGFEADRKFHRLSKLLEESYPDPVGDISSKSVDFRP